MLSKKIHQGWYSIIDECFYNEEDVEELINNNNSSKVNFQEFLDYFLQEFYENFRQIKSLFQISKITRSPVEWVQEENYVFTLSQFLEPIKKWLMRDGNHFLFLYFIFLFFSISNLGNFICCRYHLS